MANTGNSKLLSIDTLDLKGTECACDHGHGRLEAKDSTGAEVSRDTKGLDLADEAVGQFSVVSDESGRSERCGVGSPGVGVEVGSAHGEKEEISLRHRQGLRAWEFEAEFVSGETRNTRHVQAKSLVPGGNEPGAEGTNVGEVKLETVLRLGLNNLELLNLIDNKLEQLGNSEKVSDEPDRECAGRCEEANSRNHLDVVIVRVGLPVRVRMSDDVYCVGDSLDARLAVLVVKLSKSLHEKVAGLVSGSGREPGGRSGERVESLGQVPLAFVSMWYQPS